MAGYLIHLVVLATTLHLCYSWLPIIDKNVFKNCSRISFCSNLRHRVLDDADKYAADIESFVLKDNVVTIPLKNANNMLLNLKLSLLKGDKVRVKVQEINSTRYELGDLIIVEDLQTFPIMVTADKKRLTISSISHPHFHKIVVVIPGPPFSVEVYYKQSLQVVLNADRLLMESLNTSQVFTFSVEFDGASHMYGLFNHAYQLSLGETMDDSSDPFRLRNSDSWAYEANSPMALYGAIPAIYGHSQNRSSGIFLHNAAEQWIDTTYKTSRPSAYFMVEGAAFDLFILLGPTPADLTRQFTTMTGRAHMPQIWTLGYHQCRFSYKSQDDVKTVVALMDANDFPFDAIWLDGDHSDDNKWFMWNHTTFTDPVELQKNISATGRKCVSISDPHIKVDDDYAVYAGGKKNYFVKWANGSNYEADCWPGLSSWIDFLNDDASDYYASWYAYDKFNGSTETLAGIWNDMNEPAVFDDSTEKTLPFETVHNGTVKHGDIHNIYGFLQVKSTHKGLLNRDNHLKRPFILTRSTFAGSQRFAAMWTGDNSATWAHFANSYSECMTANIMGMVFCGADIGGFLGDPDDQLLQRWYQGAVWTPFFRGHSSRESKRREPYLFSPEVQEVIRNALRLRYKHIPVFYTLFFEHTTKGDPIIRPLFYQYPEIYERDTQMLIGTDIMSVAVTQENVTSVEVYIPGRLGVDNWYRIDGNRKWTLSDAGKVENAEVDITSSPVYYRAGSIIVRYDEKVRSTTEAVLTPYSIYVNLNQNGEAIGKFYKDDFISFNYTKYDNYLYYDLVYADDGIEFSIINGSPRGINFNIKSVILHSISGNGIDGEAEVVETIFTTNSDGVSLETIDIAEKLDNDSRFFLKLK